MENLVIGSIRENAGKTSIITGLAKALNKKIGYIKPFGDRLLYKKKTLWDYDSALVTNIFGLAEDPKDITVGFDHAKLRYMYDEAGIKKKLTGMVSNTGQDTDVIFVEGGKDLTYGLSVHLDAISAARHIEGKLILVVSGDDNTIMDDIAFIQHYNRMKDVNFLGVIINKVRDVDDFQETYLANITRTGLNVLGIIPYKKDLTLFSVGYLVDPLFAKVISGENALDNVVENILVGAMSFDALLRSSILQKKKRSLVITSGERGDVILAALQNNASGIILTNDILPPANIIAKAAERNIPMLLVSPDTYQVARKIDSMAPLLTKDSGDKINLLQDLVRDKVNIKDIAGF
ncbi:MAG: DRTGG domain-containing protein [Bacillota bacterium]